MATIVDRETANNLTNYRHTVYCARSNDNVNVSCCSKAITSRSHYPNMVEPSPAVKIDCERYARRYLRCAVAYIGRYGRTTRQSGRSTCIATSGRELEVNSVAKSNVAVVHLR